MPEQAKIPEYLGKCEVLHIHDDGDLTIKCGGKKYVVTTEAEVFKEVEQGNPIDKAKLAKQLEKGMELGCSFDSNTVKAWREEPPLGRLLVKKVVDEKVSYELAEKEKIGKPYKMVALNAKGFQIENWNFKEHSNLIDNFIRVCRL